MSSGSEDFFAKLGFDARAIIIGAERANTALGKLTAGTLALAKATSRYNKIAEIQIRRLKDLANTRGAANNLKKINTSVKSTATSFKTLSTNVKSASTTLDTTTQTLTKNVQNANKASSELLLSWRSVIRIFAVQLAHRTVALLTNAIRDSITAAAELSTKIAEVQTISQNNAIATGQWVSQLRDLSDSFSLDILDQTEAAYQALSSQVVRGAETFGFLADANRLALATVSSTADAVGILSATINAFSLEASDADEISASFFKTIELGRLRLSEIANTFGRVAVPASQLGIELNELQAALTVTTIKGVPAAEAMTFIRNVILKLIRPTKEMKKFFDELGVASGQAAIETFGLGGFLARLEKRTRGSATEIGKLFGRIRAIGGAMIFAGDGVDRFRVALDAIKNSSVSFQRAVDIILASTGTRFDIEISKIRNFFIVDFGDPILETVLNVSDSLGGLALTVERLTKTFVTLATIGLTAATVAAVKFLGVLALANPAIAAIIGITTVIAVLIERELELASAQRKAAKDFQKAQITNTLEANKAARAQTKVVLETLKIQNRAVATFVASVRADFNKLTRQATRDLKVLSAAIEESFEAAEEAVKKNLKKMQSELKETQSDVKILTDDLISITRGAEIFEFEFRIRDEDLPQQFAALVKRFKQQAARSGELFTLGDPKEAQRVGDAAIKTLKRVDDLQRTNSANNKKRLTDRRSINIKIADIIRKSSLAQRKASEKLSDLQSKRKRDTVAESRLVRDSNEAQSEAVQKIKKLLIGRRELKQVAISELDTLREHNKLLRERQNLQLKALKVALKAEAEQKEAIEARKLLFEEFRRAQDVAGAGIATITARETVEEQRALFVEREKAVQRAIDLSKKLGIGDEFRSRLSKKLAVEREQVERNISEITIKIAEETLKKNTEIAGQRLKSLQNFNAAQIKLAKDSDIFITRILKATKDLRVIRIDIDTRPLREAEKVAKEAQKALDSLSFGQSTTQARATVRQAEKAVAQVRKDFVDSSRAAEKSAQSQVREALQLRSVLVGLSKIPASKRTQEDLNNIARAAERLRILNNSLRTNPVVIVSTADIENFKTLENTSRSLIQNARDQLKTLEAFAKQQGNVIVNNKTLNDLITQTNKKLDNNAESINTFAEAIGSLAKALQDVSDSQFAKRVAAGQLIVRETIVNPLDPNAFGGFISRAQGGFTPQGTDSIPTLLSPGEFVVNARSTKRFFNQLRTMNSGVQRFASGGLVGGNTTIGDINITAQASGSASMDVAKVGRLLQREIRRGRIKL